MDTLSSAVDSTNDIYMYIYRLHHPEPDTLISTDHPDNHRLWGQNTQDVDWTDAVSRVCPPGYLILCFASCKFVIFTYIPNNCSFFTFKTTNNAPNQNRVYKLSLSFHSEANRC